MILCLPTVDPGGLTSRLSPHFGSAPCYTLADTESGHIEVVENTRARHEPGHCDAAKQLEGVGVGAVVCRGLGRRALAGLVGCGIPVWVTEAWSVSDALAAFRAGELHPLTHDEACGGGHGHGHGHGHDHEHDHGGHGAEPHSTG
jgi:predicted Fe-Mo cluster-binding NifX family protein